MPRDASNSELTTKTRPASAVASDCAATSAIEREDATLDAVGSVEQVGAVVGVGDTGLGHADPEPFGEGLRQREHLGSSAMRASSLSRTSPGRGEPMNVPNEIAKGRSAPGTQNVVSPTVVVRPVFRSRPSISIGPSGGVSMIWARRSAVSEMRGAIANPERSPNTMSANVQHHGRMRELGAGHAELGCVPSPSAGEAFVDLMGEAHLGGEMSRHCRPHSVST